MELSLSGLLAHLLPLGCVVAASFLQSLTGFGLAIVLAPLLMFFYDAKEVVSLVLLICVTGNLVQGVMHFREADRRLVAFLFAGVVLGQPIGAWIFFALSSDTLKFCINAMVLASLLITHVTHARFRETDANAMKTGVLSGITSATTGMGGPPFLLYMAHTKIAPEMLRATCYVFFFLCNITSLASHAIGGMSLAFVLTEYVYLLPGLAAGILLGDALFPYLPKTWIRQSINILLLVTSIVGMGEVLLK
ncbi:sulfite exporter TauE/SafE family protein [Selenomonas sp.]|uniref:sulfite exporter TauE/SafE family protein n=3 Tax=Selenomonas sp. TaxID=2053611 RepID=UPI0025D73357|nr:sulfite exporter TauE/SafE family protein [Selenomonas sp.]MCI6085431.1 sulfite exporter TauE/SafE family protein [Selenomonas sp.]MCI6283049.1 sulfite exporter TauE/SafE family protein [Selenomonas sp.]MDY3297613.1 sulfite exporter TauE/SafE family protein [Selenomonas sp.]